MAQGFFNPADVKDWSKMNTAYQDQKPVSATLPNTLTTNATKSASQLTKEQMLNSQAVGVKNNKSNSLSAQKLWNDTFQLDQAAGLKAREKMLGEANIKGVVFGQSDNTINGQPIPTSGTNDPSMFAIPQGDGLTVAQRSAKYNSPMATPTSGGAAAGGGSGGGGSSNPMDAIMGAYNSALSAGSAQSLQNQRDALAAAFQGNQIQSQLNKSLTDLISSSQAQAAASQDILNKTLASMSSGSKGAQTGMEAVDVSEQMAKEDSKRRDLRRTSAAETKKAGLLSQKALLSKPTLLGL
jgi:hypothetical protein